MSVQPVAESLRSAKRGCAPGLSGATADHYKLLLDDPTAFELLAFAVNCFARVDLPPGIIDALALSRLTRLRKPGGGVRGIATGDVFRRLVSRALARAFAGVFDEATRPYQFALSTRAGTASLAAMLRAATELPVLRKCTAPEIPVKAHDIFATSQDVSIHQRMLKPCFLQSLYRQHGPLPDELML